MSRLPFLGVVVVMALAAFAAACSGATEPEPQETATTVAPSTSATMPEPTTTVQPTTTSTSGPSTSSSSTTPPVSVSTPGEYEAASLQIRIRFESRIDGLTSAQLGEQAIETLNAPSGWSQSGFTFLADDASDLTVVLAEGTAVDALCLPLTTYGTVSCQNGATVALNEARWRLGGDDWDGTVEEYRRYLINHEVGHLIGLRHPIDRCPTASKLSALMEPQTNNLKGCVGNGIPLSWEIEWASTRPAMIGPDPDWDGLQPSWPTDSDD